MQAELCPLPSIMCLIGTRSKNAPSYEDASPNVILQGNVELAAVESYSCTPIFTSYHTFMLHTISYILT